MQEAEVRDGRVTLEGGGPTQIDFSAPMPSTAYVVLWDCRDPDDPDIQIGCTVDAANFTVSRFIVDCDIPAVFSYIAVYKPAE